MRIKDVLPERLRSRLRGVKRRLLKAGVLRAKPVHTVAAPVKSVEELVELFFGLVEELKPDLFIEAGAKEASASRRAADLKVPRVVAFEASPVTHKRFAAGNTAIEYLNLGLSDEPGTLNLHIGVDEKGALRADGKASFLERTGNVVFAPVPIPCTTLDLQFADHDFQTAAMWIDVEGATGHVLTGGSKVLSKASVVIVEVEDRAYWKGQWLADQVVAALHDSGLVPVARDRQSTYQYNVLLVRSSLLERTNEFLASR